jgi:hypothetical protein
MVNGYYKAELIYGPARTGPWKTAEDVEPATLGWVYWHNTTRLHGYLNDVPPAEYEAALSLAGSRVLHKLMSRCAIESVGRRSPSKSRLTLRDPGWQ